MIKIEIRGLNLENIKKISKLKGEDDYFLNYRIESFNNFLNIKDPKFGPKYNIDYDKVIYYKNSTSGMKNDWRMIDNNIKCEFKDLGVIESEKNLDGIGIQYESEVI